MDIALWRGLEEEYCTFISAFSVCYSSAAFHKHGLRLGIVISSVRWLQSGNELRCYRGNVSIISIRVQSINEDFKSILLLGHEPEANISLIGATSGGKG